MAGGPTLKLNSGHEIPQIGLGTWLSKPNEVAKAVESALKDGYRHIDGATIYQNENEVGAGWKASGVPREEIFLTTKNWNNARTKEGVKKQLDQSLKELQTDYVDLLLIHWPVVFKTGEELFPHNAVIVEKRGRGRPRKNPIVVAPAPLWPTPDLVQFGGADPYEEIDSFSAERIEEQAGQEGANLTHPEKLALIKRRLHAEAQDKDLLEALATNREDFFNADEAKDVYSQYSVLRHHIALLLQNYGDTDEGRVIKRNLSNLMGVLRYLRLKDNILSELLTIVPLIQDQDYTGAKNRIQALDGPWCIGTPSNREIRLRETQKWITGLVQLLEWSDGSYNGLYRV